MAHDSFDNYDIKNQKVTCVPNMRAVQVKSFENELSQVSCNTQKNICYTFILHVSEKNTNFAGWQKTMMPQHKE